jgi:hypothetical protein
VLEVLDEQEKELNEYIGQEHTIKEKKPQIKKKKIKENTKPVQGASQPKLIMEDYVDKMN